jgi:hypothetical protein
MSAHIPQRHAKQDLLLDEGALAERIFQHIDAATTDLGE